MSGKDSKPDNVTHDSYGTLPFTGGGLTIHKTTIEKDDRTYTGYGSSRDEADRNAGEKYSDGDED